jgi:hypothetical protein
MDYIKFGTPLQIILLIFSTTILSIPTGMWYLAWIGTILAFVFAAVFQYLASTPSV